MTKKKILFYTDCPIFGGCEKPIFKLLSSDDFNSRYDFKVIFRKRKEYLSGLELFWPSYPKAKFLGIKLFDVNTPSYYLTRKVSNPLFLKIGGKSIELVFIFLTPFIFIYDFLLLSLYFRRNKADIIHINNGGYPGALSCRAAAVAAKSAGFKKIIFNVHNTALTNGGLVGRAIDYLVKRSVDMIVTGSRASGLALARNRGFDKNKMVTIYHGVDTPKGPPGGTSVKENACLEKYISMVARFEDRKGHEYAVRAFKRVIEAGPSFAGLKLVLIGDGPTLNDIKKLVASERLGKNVLFTGHRNDYIDYVASSLFLLNSSVGYEDLPYIILEAMSMGVPVIGTDISGIPEEVEDGITGIIVPPKDIGALERAILELLFDQSRRIRMGNAARERFLNLFTVNKMVGGYLTLYG